jgi:hypothetical protein
MLGLYTDEPAFQASKAIAKKIAWAIISPTARRWDFTQLTPLQRRYARVRAASRSRGLRSHVSSRSPGFWRSVPQAPAAIR